MTGPIRIILVDDSAVVRGLISRWLEGEPDIEIVASVATGLKALPAVEKHQPDVVVLDIEMPEMDGLEALPEILKRAPGVKVIMASTLTERHARISLKAILSGAADYVPKPSTSVGGSGAEAFRNELLEKIRGHASGRQKRVRSIPKLADDLRAPRLKTETGGGETSVIAIGGSTGGPQALFALFKKFPAALSRPVLLAQHMPPAFTAMLAQHLANVSGMPAQEGQDGQVAEPGRIYVAPGNTHMRITGSRTRPIIQITQDPPVNHCRPSVDPLFQSVADVFGDQALAIMLTGMGADGCAGARHIKQAGGICVVQDEASSVVWGMPGAVAEAGLADAELDIAKMANGVAALISGRKMRRNLAVVDTAGSVR